MKKVLLLLFVITSFLVHAQPDRLLLASDVWPPFTNVEAGQRVAIGLVVEALKRDQVVAINEIVDFGQVTTGIETGKYQGSAALWISDERKDQLVFSEPYLQNRLVLVGRKGADVSAATFDDLTDQKVAVVGNYAYGAELDAAEGVEFVDGESDQQNLRKLLAEEVDYMLVDALLVQYLSIYHRQEIGQYLEVGTNPLMVRSLHLGLRKDVEGVEVIIENFNRRIQEMAMDGTYNRILQVNWIKVDADGDGKLEYVLRGTQAGQVAPATGYSLFSSSGAAAAGADQYMINGKVYKGWDAVPNQYKAMPTTNESLNKLKILDFAVPGGPRN